MSVCVCLCMRACLYVRARVRARAFVCVCVSAFRMFAGVCLLPCVFGLCAGGHGVADVSPYVFLRAKVWV